MMIMSVFTRRIGRLARQAGVGLVAVLCFSACAGFRTLEVSVLQPGKLNLEKSNLRVMFLDRKLIHETDRFTAAALYQAVGLRRADVVDCFYDGLRDGLRNGVRPVSLTKGLGLSPRYIPDGMVPTPMTLMEIRRGNRVGNNQYILGMEYCDFGLVGGREVHLDDNILLRLYRVADGSVVDEVRSDTLGLRAETVPGDDFATICNFFYNKGWAYAERMLPTWKPTLRRIYGGNRVLELGDYYFEQEKYDDAQTVWTRALSMKPIVAVKAAVNLAWLYERQENYEAAKALLEAALKSYPGRKDPALQNYVEDYLRDIQERIDTEDEITNQL